MKSYRRVIKNKNQLENVEKESSTDEKTPGMIKINLIERLIGVLETNKNVRIREMFE